METHTAISSTPPRLNPQRMRTSSRSPTRPRIDDILSDLSPTSTLEALTSPSGKLRASVEAASASERAFGIRATLASKKIEEWVTELSAWPWPEAGRAEGFQSPPSKRRKLSLGDSDERRPRSGYQETNNQGSAEILYIGSLPAQDVLEYEKRVEEIHEDMEDLDVEEIKRTVLSNFSPKSRPSSSASNAAPLLSQLSSYTKMDDFTAVVAATVLQSLPNLMRLMRLMDVWSIRLTVLKKVPPLLQMLDDAEVALKSGWQAIRAPGQGNGSLKNHYLERNEFEVMKAVLQDKVTVLGQELDYMLDTLEGREDVLPEQWLDRMEFIETDYGDWAVRGDMKVREGEWAKLAKKRKEESDRLLAEEAAREATRLKEEQAREAEAARLKAEQEAIEAACQEAECVRRAARKRELAMEAERIEAERVQAEEAKLKLEVQAARERAEQARLEREAALALQGKKDEEASRLAEEQAQIALEADLLAREQEAARKNSMAKAEERNLREISLLSDASSFEHIVSVRSPAIEIVIASEPASIQGQRIMESDISQGSSSPDSSDTSDSHVSSFDGSSNEPRVGSTTEDKDHPTTYADIVQHNRNSSGPKPALPVALNPSASDSTGSQELEKAKAVPSIQPANDWVVVINPIDYMATFKDYTPEERAEIPAEVQVMPTSNPSSDRANVDGATPNVASIEDSVDGASESILQPPRSDSVQLQEQFPTPHSSVAATSPEIDADTSRRYSLCSNSSSVVTRFNSDAPSPPPPPPHSPPPNPYNRSDYNSEISDHFPDLDDQSLTTRLSRQANLDNLKQNAPVPIPHKDDSQVSLPNFSVPLIESPHNPWKDVVSSTSRDIPNLPGLESSSSPTTSSNQDNPTTPTTDTSEIPSLTPSSPFDVPSTPIIGAPSLPNLELSPSLPTSPKIAAIGDNPMQSQISSLLASLPARIRLEYEPELDSLSRSGLASPQNVTYRPAKMRRSLTPTMRSYSSMSSRAPTPNFTLRPAYGKGAPRARHASAHPEINVYHLSHHGEAPIKLFIRRVGENGERLMVRVGGGWSDLGAYLTEYAAHHGHRVSSGQHSNKIEVQNFGTGTASRSVSGSSTATARGTRGGTPSGRDSPGPRPQSVMERERPLSSLYVRKTRKSVGEKSESTAGIVSLRSPSTPLPASQMTSPNYSTPPSRSVSRLSWTEEETGLGLAGPSARPKAISPESQEWVQSMTEKVKQASAEKEEKSRKSYGELGGGGIKKLFRKKSEAKFGL